MEPFEILLREMWEEILDRLDHPLDRLNFVSSHWQLDETFYHIKVEQCHFPAILPIVMDYFGKDSNCYENKELNKAFRTCRLVSSYCCRAVDQYIEDYWRKLRRPPSFVKTPIFWDPRGIVNFLDKIGDHPVKRKTPLLSRDITGTCKLADLDQEGFDDLYRSPTGEEMETLLNQIGYHLWGIDLTILVTEQAEASNEFLRNVLSSIPNVQYLKLQLVNSVSILPGIHVEGHNLLNSNTALLLPSLPNLEELLITNSDLTFVTGAHAFKQYFSQLSILTLDFRMWKGYHLNCVFSQLKYLTLQSISVPEAEDKVYEILGQMEAPKMERLVLETKTANYSKTISDSHFIDCSISCSFGSLAEKHIILALKQRRPDSNWKCFTHLKLLFGYYYMFLIKE